MLADRVMAGAIAFLLGLTFWLLAGCSMWIPGVGLTGLGTHYHHAEWDSETGNKIWETNLFRSWGTSRANTFVNTESERIGIEGEGMSANMQETLGDDVVEKGLDVVSQNLRPGAQAEDNLTKGSDLDRALADRE